MDITTQAVSDTAIIHVKSASGEHLYDGEDPVQIEVYGPGTRQHGAMEARQAERAMKRYKDSDGKSISVPYEEQVANMAEDLASITKRFINLTYPPAGKAEGPALFEALYKDRTLGFITKQVTGCVGDWGKFKVSSGQS